MLKIVQAPDPVLSAKAKPVGNIDKSIQRLIKDMEEALVNARDPEGIGLAAPQVGKSLQIFIIKQTRRSQTLVFINPVIEEIIDAPGEESVPPAKATVNNEERAKIEELRTKNKEKKQRPDEDSKGVQLEGCLSLYSIWGEVKRHPGLMLSYQDETGKKHKRKFTGFIAIIIQHEYDHLQGVLFPKRVLEKNGKLYKSTKNEKGESVFEEIEL